MCCMRRAPKQSQFIRKGVVRSCMTQKIKLVSRIYLGDYYYSIYSRDFKKFTRVAMVCMRGLSSVSGMRRSKLFCSACATMAIKLCSRVLPYLGIVYIDMSNIMHLSYSTHGWTKQKCEKARVHDTHRFWRRSSGPFFCASHARTSLCTNDQLLVVQRGAASFFLGDRQQLRGGNKLFSSRAGPNPTTSISNKFRRRFQ